LIRRGGSDKRTPPFFICIISNTIYGIIKRGKEETMIAVKFTTNHAPYKAGDIAGVDDNEVEGLVKAE
jgi:hypothetical protein